MVNNWLNLRSQKMFGGQVFICFGLLWISHFVPLVLSGDSNEQSVGFNQFYLPFFFWFQAVFHLQNVYFILSQKYFYSPFSSVHIKLHVPQIIKKHTHTRTVFKHHFGRPKGASAKSLTSFSNARLDPTYKSSRKLPHSISALESSGRVKSQDQLWKPSLSEYRSVESNYVPKKLKLAKKKNPFKLLEIMAEAQAEGHTFSPQGLYNNNNHNNNDDYFDSEDNENVPEYMLSDNSRFAPSELYSSSDHVGRNAGHKDLLRLHSQSDEKSVHSPVSSFVPSWGISAPTPETAAHTFDWSTGYSTSGSDYKKKKTKLFTSALDSEEIEVVTPKIKKLRNKSRHHTPTLDTSEDHSNILKLTRKPISLTNFTKYKNKFNVMSNLNTSIWAGAGVANAVRASIPFHWFFAKLKNHNHYNNLVKFFFC